MGLRKRLDRPAGTRGKVDEILHRYHPRKPPVDLRGTGTRGRRSDLLWSPVQGRDTKVETLTGTEVTCPDSFSTLEVPESIRVRSETLWFCWSARVKESRRPRSDETPFLSLSLPITGYEGSVSTCKINKLKNLFIT